MTMDANTAAVLQVACQAVMVVGVAWAIAWVFSKVFS